MIKQTIGDMNKVNTNTTEYTVTAKELRDNIEWTTKRIAVIRHTKPPSLTAELFSLRDYRSLLRSKLARLSRHN